jgi:ABC-2 type transport system ATP-binding protein
VVVSGTPDGLKGELRGDAVRVELLDRADPAAAQRAIAAVPGIREVVADGRQLSARTDDGAAAVPGILAALDRTGGDVAAVTVARPSLDDVYLRHVGRHLDAAADPTAITPSVATSSTASVTASGAAT